MYTLPTIKPLITQQKVKKETVNDEVFDYVDAAYKLSYLVREWDRDTLASPIIDEHVKRIINHGYNFLLWLYLHTCFSWCLIENNTHLLCLS